MLKSLLICTALVATPALAQMDNTGGMDHSAMAGMAGMAGMNMGDTQGTSGADMSGMMNGAGKAGMMEKMQSMMGKFAMQQMMGQMMMDQMGGAQNGAGGMDHAAMMANGGSMASTAGAAQAQGVGGSPLSEPGQSAFAAIAEVVAVLEADPNTDWNNVNIDALREHLRDMDVVTIDSTAVAEDVDGGVRFTITGAPDVVPSITRMALGHASVMDGVDGWKYSAEALDNGATLTVLVPDSDLAKLKGIGFYGLLASGMHHQPHHWMMANGGGMGG